MNNITPEQLELIAEIESAFKYVKREGGITLHQAVAIHNGYTKEEELKARKLDTDSDWQNILDKDIIQYDFIFSFLDPKSLRYYLPAYMRFYTKYPEQYDDFYTIYGLIPLSNAQGKRPDRSVLAIARELDLNKKQCKAIFNFLKFREKDYDIDKEKSEWISGLERWKKLSQ